MLANAVRICEASFGVLFRFENGAARAAAMLGVPTAFAEFWQRGPRRPGPRTALGRVVETRQTVHIVDVTTEPAYVAGEPVFLAAANLGGFRSFLNVPMVKENELIGVFAIYRQEVRPFTDNEGGRTRVCTTPRQAYRSKWPLWSIEGRFSKWPNRIVSRPPTRGTCAE